MKFTMVNLKKYHPNYPKKPIILTLLWMVFSFLFLENSLPIPQIVKKTLLRLFGAKIGVGVVIKPSVKIKYPWYLVIGNYSWIGEKVWLDNITTIEIGNNVCISQLAYLTTGNHNYKLETFDLILEKITIHDGVWIGANTTVCPGVVCKENSILCAGSVLTKSMNENQIFQGNPAVLKKSR